MAVLLVGGTLVAGMSGVLGADGEPSKPAVSRPRAASELVGVGAGSARIVRARGPARRPVVIFLHGWGLTGPTAYRGWIRHLTSRGSTVIVPRYQASLRTPSSEVLANALSGVRLALRALSPRPRQVVVVGHSVGGILAVDYAARASQGNLPGAAAMMIIFPGGKIRDMPDVPEADPAQIPSTVVRMLVLASPTDEIVGDDPAQGIIDGSSAVARRRLVTVNDPVAGDHFAPALDAPASRRVFWRMLDELLSPKSATTPITPPAARTGP